MENFYDPNLAQNDNEFMSNNIQNRVNNIENNDIPPNVYNPVTFQTEILIKYFQDVGIFKKNVYCHKCGNLCNLVKDSQVIDKLIWRCRGKSDGHDVKINVRDKSILSGLHINIQNLYFLIFHCFCEGKSISESVIDCSDFSKKIGVPGSTISSVRKIFAIIRNKIKEYTHKEWSKSFLGEVIGDNGYASIKID